MGKPEDSCNDLSTVMQRVNKKANDYKSYHFSRFHNDILKTFFDLAQEFDSLEDLYRICVVVPSFYLDIQVRLYLLDSHTHKLELVCDSKHGVYSETKVAPAYLHPTKNSYEYDDSCLVPIYREHLKSDDESFPMLQSSLLGMLEVYPKHNLNEGDDFFFGKFANRIAYNLHNRRLALQNIKHLEFINNLVMDIEHNVIIPNMYFRHLFKQLRKSLNRLDEIVESVSAVGGGLPVSHEVMEQMLGLRDELGKNHRHLLDHHSNTSLFLESLFRRDHFRKGHLVLKTRRCMVESEIIMPQLENFLSRFELYGIDVECPGGMEEEICLTVDIGLLAQVYANLFSNGVKYAATIVKKDGSKRKAMAYGRELCRDLFGQGKDGIKFNVFTTGQHLVENELSRIFEDGFRGINSAKKSGTGHGLSFVKQVVEIHGGRVGCELVEEGNNFFFVLPMSQPETMTNAD